MIAQAPRGTYDLYGEQVRKWRSIEKTITRLMEDFHYGEIRTPMFEHTELFQRGVGDTTDIVQKEMYTFLDKGNRSITLKPKGSAGAARAFLEHKMFADPAANKVVLYYPLFSVRKTTGRAGSSVLAVWRRTVWGSGSSGGCRSDFYCARVVKAFRNS